MSSGDLLGLRQTLRAFGLRRLLFGASPKRVAEVAEAAFPPVERGVAVLSFWCNRQVVGLVSAVLGLFITIFGGAIGKIWADSLGSWCHISIIYIVAFCMFIFLN